MPIDLELEKKSPTRLEDGLMCGAMALLLLMISIAANLVEFICGVMPGTPLMLFLWTAWAVTSDLTFRGERLGEIMSLLTRLLLIWLWAPDLAMLPLTLPVMLLLFLEPSCFWALWWLANELS